MQNVTYTYDKHNIYEVVIKAKGIINKFSLDQGTETTSCTQKYSRMLEDDGENDCDAGHILANRLEDMAIYQLIFFHKFINE